ncbi:DUF6597 domain-containing transcriptional factor [Pendulispora albinea]|uniref:AraC family transcriptional regulator n=1 Tax=Pendulispora albinea TaxID=2741071 RepID=A0ABZ2M5V5_9BACT
MMVTRDPSPQLRPFVKAMWATDGRPPGGGPESEPRPSPVPRRERVLPSGTMHVVFRLSDDPLRLFEDENDPVGHVVGHCIVGGARSAYYVRDISRPARSIGVQFHPGVAERLLGVPAGELMEHHTPLEDVWGRAAPEIRERLELAGSPERSLALLDTILSERLGVVRARGPHPLVTRALALFEATTDVRRVVDASGYSHRQFIARFRDAIGLTPKIYCRILRFQRALGSVLQGGSASRGSWASWADLAMAAGYADQAHFNREFRAFSGITPGRYRDLAPPWSHHVPIPSAAEPSPIRR